MKKLLLLIALALEASAVSTGSNKLAKPGCLLADILFVTDWSSSMSDQTLVFNAFNEFANRLDLSPEGIRLGFISFADQASLDLPFTADSRELVTMESALKLRSPSGATNISLPLRLARSVFAHVPEGRYHNTKKVIIFISDGQWWPNEDLSDSILATNEAEKLREMGIYVYAIDPGTTDSHPGMLKAIATDPSYYMVSSYRELAQTLRRLDFCM